jgi:hypothetical protein
MTFVGQAGRNPGTDTSPDTGTNDTPDTGPDNESLNRTRAD